MVYLVVWLPLVVMCYLSLREDWPRELRDLDIKIFYWFRGACYFSKMVQGVGTVQVDTCTGGWIITKNFHRLLETKDSVKYKQGLKGDFIRICWMETPAVDFLLVTLEGKATSGALLLNKGMKMALQSSFKGLAVGWSQRS